mmetsp:Transcript_17043/g.26329  ORF Transcript_17043/g.26329 Transcript_17043/m.26329 type:complete len:81 (+) Transcript_17043:2-244(+)
MKWTTLLALTAPVAAKDVADGRCPFGPGQIKGAVDDSLDLRRIQGQWITMYDEKELANQYLCMGAKFLQFNDKDPQELSF